MEDKIHKMAVKAVMTVMRGEGLHGSEMAELLHLLKHAAHEVKETLKDTAPKDDEDSDQRNRP